MRSVPVSRPKNTSWVTPTNSVPSMKSVMWEGSATNMLGLGLAVVGDLPDRDCETRDRNISDLSSWAFIVHVPVHTAVADLNEGEIRRGIG